MHIFEGGETPFILACIFGRSKIVEIMIQNSVDFNIDLNAKSDNECFASFSGFQLACLNEHFDVVEMIVQKSIEFNIDLNSKCNRSTGISGTYRDIDTLKNWKKVEHYKTDNTIVKVGTKT